MQISIIQNNRALRVYQHQGQGYIEVPEYGSYGIRLTNNHHATRMAVVSVDGINVLDGKDAGFNGPGYVLRPWETLDIKGWRRSDTEVAEFTFSPDTGSYAEGTGRGTRNTGIIGVAVFDEKEKPVEKTRIIERVVERPVYPYPWTRPWYPWYPPTWYEYTGVDMTPTILRSFSAGTYQTKGSDLGGIECCAPSAVVSNSIPAAQDLGTGYGQRATMYTSSVEFKKAHSTPAMVLTFRYGTRAKLESWGVPLSSPMTEQPNPFPAGPCCPAPAGWRG